MNENKQKGLITELECQLAFSKLGAMVCQPINDDSRYDFLIDLGNYHILRIQCKTCSIHCENKYIQFAARSSNNHNSKIYTKQEIDYFYTNYENQSYLIPVEECSVEKRLWFDTPENGQTKGISFAKNYELEKILREKEDFIGTKIERNICLSEKERKSSNQCELCGQEISNKAKMCQQCYNLSRRKVERPTREELKMLIRTTSFVQIGKQFNLSDNAIKKWCKDYNLPDKKKDINLYTDEQWQLI